MRFGALYCISCIKIIKLSFSFFLFLLFLFFLSFFFFSGVGWGPGPQPLAAPLLYAKKQTALRQETNGFKMYNQTQSQTLHAKNRQRKNFFYCRLLCTIFFPAFQFVFLRIIVHGSIVVAQALMRPVRQLCSYRCD